MRFDLTVIKRPTMLPSLQTYGSASGFFKPAGESLALYEDRKAFWSEIISSISSISSIAMLRFKRESGLVTTSQIDKL